MKLSEIFPPANTVQEVSQFLVDLGERGRWQYHFIDAALLYLLAALALFSVLQDGRRDTPGIVRRTLMSDYLFFALVILFALMSRIPLAVLGILNPDEPLWVAGAKTFLHDPRPYLSVDTGTGGPLVPLALLPIRLVGLPIDQGSIKIMGAFMMTLSAGLAFLGLSKLTGSAFARLAILPLVVAVAVMKNWELIAYNSEHPVILLLALAFFFLARTTSGPGRFRVNPVLVGLSLGLIPFAKLQGVPIALYLGLAACLLVYTTQPLKNLAVLIGSALAPTALALLALWGYGALDNFWSSYILSNFTYASQAVIVGFVPRLNTILTLIFMPAELRGFLYISIGVMAAGLLLIAIRVRGLTRDQAVTIVFSTLLLVASVFSAMAPGRPFIHYALLLLIPMAIQTGVTMQIAFRLYDSNPRPNSIFRIVLAGLLLLSTLYYFHTYDKQQSAYMTEANRHYERYSPQGEVVAVMQHYLPPDNKRVAVWEYEPELFEGGDFYMGTRYAAIFMLGTPLDGYHLDSYLTDMDRNRPPLFVESFYRTLNGFEVVPELRDYIRQHYTADAEIGGNRIYVRNDLLANPRTWYVTRKIRDLGTMGFHGTLTELKRNGTFMQFTGWTVTQYVLDHTSFGEDLNRQHVMLAVMSKSDTLLIDSYQTRNSGISQFSGKPEHLLSGYVGLIPIRDIPPGDYRLGILVENGDNLLFKDFSQVLNRDSLK